MNIRIVLVGTTHPGNIGSAARAMKTMGLSDLALVSPRERPDAEAEARATGAGDVLASAAIHDNLDAAIADCQLVIGASARTRRLGALPMTPPEMARLVTERTSGEARAAILLGRERTGLTNEELDRCHHLVHIPANPDYSSLNLAAATQVLAYELRMAHLALAGETGMPESGSKTQPLATAGELEHLYEHFEQVLLDLGFLDRSNPRQLMRRIRRFFGRALPDRNEVNIFRGILSAVEGRGSAPRRLAERGKSRDAD